MSDDISMRVIQLAGQGFCCSQIVVILALETQGTYNTELVRAVSGMCKGLGDCSGPCGALSGGVCTLALYAGRGSDEEEADSRLPLMLNTLTEWFHETVGEKYGDISCLTILGLEKCGKPDPSRCAPIVTETFMRCLEILAENGFDPTVSKEDA